jgi:ubiquinone/menaquinone biosynthesis C-methylase UbiE
VIFEGIAIAQLVLGILMFRGLIFKRGTDELAMPGIGFTIMRTVLRVRNIFGKPEKILRDVGIKKGQTVLDYGCGIGSFCIPLSEMVGGDGVVYALDVHPLAIKAIEREIEKKGISNIRPILSNMDTGLSDESVDVILLYDVLQMIPEKEKLLKELHRVLKPDGILFATAKYLDVDEFMSVLTKADLFTLVERKGEIFTFRRS